MSSDNGTDFESERASECRIATFIRKLYTMLEESLHPDIFDWTEDGESIIIKKPAEFGSKLLPKYFKHNRITSFIRQLNMYNFQKKRSRNVEHIYSHDLFKRGQKHMLIQIKRKVKDGLLPSQQANSQSVAGLEVNGSDINVIIHENKMLKDLQDQTNSRIQLLEEQLNELTSENQSLLMQIQQQKGKQNSMMEAFLQMRRNNNSNQPFIYNEDKANDESNQLGHKLVVTKSALLKNNSNTEPLADGKIPILQTADTSAIYAGAYTGQDGKNGLLMSTSNMFAMNDLNNKMTPQGLKPILPNMGPYDGFYGDSMMGNYRNSMADYNANMSLLGKRASMLEEERKFYNDMEVGDLSKRFMKNPVFGFDERTTLNISDIRKLRQGFFSSLGDKEYENTFDNTELDLLCFQ